MVVTMGGVAVLAAAALTEPGDVPLGIVIGVLVFAMACAAAVKLLVYRRNGLRAGHQQRRH